MSHHQSLFGLDLVATACFSRVLCHDDIHNHAKIKHFYAFLEFSKHRNMLGFFRGGGIGTNDTKSSIEHKYMDIHNRIQGGKY